MVTESAKSGPHVRRLRVAEVIKETLDAHSLVFDTPCTGGSSFAYRPGQFLTLRIPADDGAVARCYSLASSPYVEGALKITVKRVLDGRGSNWICDNVTAGTVLEVLPPAGTFTPRSLEGDFLLFAGGSGITPIMSILKSALENGDGNVVLLYANRDERSVIFRDELVALDDAHPGRLMVSHWLESVQALPTPRQLRDLAAPFAGYESFVCGPAPFMTAVDEALRQLDVPRERVHMERFISLSQDPFQSGSAPAASAPADAGDHTSVEIELDGRTHRYLWDRQTTLLDLLLDKGLDAPFSCREGACGACICRVEDGEVKMLHDVLLDEQDIAEGYVLACQALPVTGTVKVSYS
ncbi:ferredoxin--NADP reductase [Streptomyces sp. NPDC005373]|uniref:ferredoxin--NADP reductase n=1 Tax=Streptomyces sp. NPDC005373 TaxID=3156879 RepID=UPI0033B8CEE2